MVSGGLAKSCHSLFARLRKVRDQPRGGWAEKIGPGRSAEEKNNAGSCFSSRTIVKVERRGETENSNLALLIEGRSWVCAVYSSGVVGECGADRRRHRGRWSKRETTTTRDRLLQSFGEDAGPEKFRVSLQRPSVDHQRSSTTTAIATLSTLIVSWPTQPTAITAKVLLRKITSPSAFTSKAEVPTAFPGRHQISVKTNLSCHRHGAPHNKR